MLVIHLFCMSPIASAKAGVPIGVLRCPRTTYLLADCRSVCASIVLYCIVVAFGHLHPEARDLRGLYVCMYVCMYVLDR